MNVNKSQAVREAFAALGGIEAGTQDVIRFCAEKSKVQINPQIVANVRRNLRARVAAGEEKKAPATNGAHPSQHDVLRAVKDLAGWAGGLDRVEAAVSTFKELTS